jgi:diguanylate cyclase (GGDEF)-like protein
MRITTRFVLVLVVLVLSLVAVGGVGLAGLQSAREYLSVIHQDNVLNNRVIVDLQESIDETQEQVLELKAAEGSIERGHITVRIVSATFPAVEVGIAEVIQDLDEFPDSERVAQRIESDWARFRTLWGTGQLSDRNPAVRSAGVEQALGILRSAEANLHNLLGLEGAEADTRYREAAASYTSSVRLMIAILILGLVLGGGALLWLIRAVLPRMLTYSRVARHFADGDFSERLDPRGTDEIDQLGRTIDEVASRREKEERYETAQSEFIDILQLTGDEGEAQGLLKRHLERSITGSEVTILNRNNSADRLEAVTNVAPDSPLHGGLDAAVPRSCLAVRTARPHSQVHGENQLVACTVCAGCPGRSTCTPLLVSGEVIGSVLINHESELNDESQRRLRDSVSQAAPVLANLRNLAIAQFRASTDSLTGLPNRRGLQDTLRRMVAHASRTGTSVAGLMIDLDHFKQVNDQFGHGPGDEVLAAFGVLLRGLLRESDFAGRYGGEEFFVLLPTTDEEKARTVAEKIRLAVKELRVSTIDRQITVSVGVAVFPNQADDAESLERGADRALYAAKSRGRDRVELATGKEPVAPDLGTQDGKSASQEGRETRMGPGHDADKIAAASAETPS